MVKTSFWFDDWSQRGRLIDQMGPRGFIDLGIQGDATVASVLSKHRFWNHRSEVLDGIEEVIRMLYQKPLLGEDRVL